MASDEETPALEDVEELGDGYWSKDTTITVSRYTKANLDKYRDGRPWDQFLEKLRREHADPLTFNDAEQIAEYISDEVDVDLDAEDATEVNGDPGQLSPIAERLSKLQTDIEQLKAITERVPQDTAEKLEGRFR